MKIKVKSSTEKSRFVTKRLFFMYVANNVFSEIQLKSNKKALLLQDSVYITSALALGLRQFKMLIKNRISLDCLAILKRRSSHLFASPNCFYKKQFELLATPELSQLVSCETQLLSEFKKQKSLATARLHIYKGYLKYPLKTE